MTPDGPPAAPPAHVPGATALGMRRLLLVVTGSSTAAEMPLLVSWLRAAYADLEPLVVLTRSATRFVTPTALAGRSGSDVVVDEWPADGWHARHVQWAGWAEGILVYPATLSWVSRLALGLADSPALLAAQCTTAPVVLAPALPPGGVQSAAYRMHWESLTDRPNVAIAPPRPGVSQTTGQADGWTPAPLEQALELLERCRAVPR